MIEADLLAAIIAQPDTEPPRLVYADWLIARGDPRGELIVVQHQLAARPDDDVLRERERALIDAATDAVTAPLDPATVRVAIRRWHGGFVDALRVGADLAALPLSQLVEWLHQPELQLVRELELEPRSRGQLRAVTRDPLRRSVRQLRLGTPTSTLDPTMLRMVADGWTGVTDLTLSARSVPSIAAIATMKLERLGVVTRAGLQTRDAWIDELLDLPCDLRRLTIDVAGRVEAAAVERILQSAAFPNLREIELRGLFPVVATFAALASHRAATLDAIHFDFMLVDDDVAPQLAPFRAALARVRLVQTPTKQGTAYHRLGSLLTHHLGRVHDAVPSYAEAVRLDPKNPLARHGYGAVLRRAGQPARSLEELDALLALPGYTPTAGMLNARSLTLDQLGRRDEARADLERAVEVNPSYALAWSNLASARRRAGDLAGADGALRRAAELDPDYAASAAQLLLERELPAAALDSLASTLADAPELWSRELAAQAHIMLGHRAEAISILDDVLATPGCKRCGPLVRRAIADLDRPEAQRDLDGVLAEATTIRFVSLARLLSRDRTAWREIVPTIAVAPADIVDVWLDHARRARLDAVDLGKLDACQRFHVALDAAVAAALDGDRVVATRRLDALTAELAHPLAFEWWALQGLAHWALARELPEDARELVRTLERASYYGP